MQDTVLVDLLKSNLSAFADRLATIRAAKKSIELMYYIWREDTSGAILLHEILQAAERGVRVRILLDALNFAGPESLFIGLDQHPNVEVRLYNPFYYGFLNQVFKFFEFLLRATSLNRRLHNKLWLVDRETAICGGRNIGDEYFGNKKTANFTDLDIGITGASIAQQFGECFDVFWQSKQVKRLSQIRGLEPQSTYETYIALLESKRNVADNTEFGKLLHSQKMPHEEADNFQISADDILVVWDPPRKNLPVKLNHRTTAAEVFRLLTSAQASACIVSPYFVPGPRGARAMQIAAQKSCHVQVLTNSLAATDAIAAHSGVVKYRRALLKAGTQLFELKPTGKLRKRLGILPKSRASLHAKVIVVDEIKSYIGSFNLDPRSALLNCEMGVVVKHQSLAQETLRLYKEASDPANAWQLILSKENKLTWTGIDENGQKEIYFSEPQASRTKRLTAWFISLLPIEPLL